MPFESQLRELLFPTIGLAVGIAAGMIVRTVILPKLSKLTAHTDTKLDDVFIDAARGPVVLWTSLLGLYVGIGVAGYAQTVIDTIHKPLLAIVIMSVSWTVGRIVGSIVRLPEGPAGALPSARILSTAAQASVLCVGFLVAVQSLGVSVAPILTALGVGGLAVGLALQDTLANLFAGFHILVSRQVRPGDFVQLESGARGFVEDITWRNTTIRQLPNNMLIVPNAKLAQSIMLNLSLPETQQSVVVQVGVSYDENLGDVERVTIEVARTVQLDVDGAVRDHEPFTRYHTFGDSSINFSVVMRANQFTDNYLMKHEFVKRLHARYRAEGITIPYPQRTLHFDGPPWPPSSP